MKTSFTLVLCALLAAVGLPVTGAVLPGASPVVSTDRGPVQGLVEGGIAAYKGIPYAAAPVGALRFKAPEPAPEWTAILDATGFGAPAMQSYDRELNGSELSIQLATVFTMRTGMKFDNEDCLYLNVRAPPASGEPRPVLVCFHGGGNSTGHARIQAFGSRRIRPIAHPHGDAMALFDQAFAAPE